jgi:hypothetical protein
MILLAGVIILILTLGLLCFSFEYYQSEGFQNLLDVEPPFIKSQNVTYNNYEKDIIVNPGVKDMTSALAVPDIFLDMDTSDSVLVAQRLIEDPTNKYTDYDNKYCRGALQPANLPRHLRGARDGCGWWYVADPSQTSTGVLGTINGPTFRDGLVSNGQWVWDLVKAQELEEIKLCRQITMCELIDTNAVHGRCGFCPTSGYAVPVKSDGTEKYLKNTNATCGTQVIMNGSDCEALRQKGRVITASDGTECGTFGTPSDDRKLRMYSKDECNNFNGVLSSDGQCRSPIGGNYSEDCANLNKPITTVCTPDVNGRLSTSCLISVAKGLGYTTSGAILRILKTSGNLTENDRVAMAQLANIGVNIPDTILSGGDIGGIGKVGGKIDINTAANLYMKIKEQMRLGIHRRIREAAKWFVVGTTNFDPCGFDNNERGPFPLLCLQQLWRVSGCQPAGDGYPRTEADTTKYNSMTWGDISAIFERNYMALQGANGAEAQDADVKKCLGIDVTRKTSPACKSAPAPPPPVVLPTFYPDYNFKGAGVPLDVGNYPFTKFIKYIPNDSVSSIKVPPGYVVTAYQDDIGSRSQVFTYDTPDIRTRGIDKMISALTISKHN